MAQASPQATCPLSLRTSCDCDLLTSRLFFFSIVPLPYFLLSIFISTKSESSATDFFFFFLGLIISGDSDFYGGFTFSFSCFAFDLSVLWVFSGFYSFSFSLFFFLSFFLPSSWFLSFFFSFFKLSDFYFSSSLSTGRRFFSFFFLILPSLIIVASSSAWSSYFLADFLGFSGFGFSYLAGVSITRVFKFCFCPP